VPDKPVLRLVYTSPPPLPIDAEMCSNLRAVTIDLARLRRIRILGKIS
jgi:hypothetical protein